MISSESDPGVRRALVTGASGFVGRALCAELKRKGVFVRGAARRETTGPWDEFMVLDLEEQKLPPSLLVNIDSVFHLAGKAHSLAHKPADILAYYQTNFEGTRRLISLAKEHHVRRFIFVSSVKAGSDKEAYGGSKLMAEQEVLRAVDEGFHGVVVRPALIYGPNWKGNLLRMSEAVRLGRFPPVAEYGNQRSMVHVEDVARALLLVAESARANGRVYILTDGQGYSTRRIYLAMCAALGRNPPSWTISLTLLRRLAQVGDWVERALRVRMPVNSEVLRRVSESELYESTEISQETGWVPRYVFEEALPGILTDERSGPKAGA